MIRVIINQEPIDAERMGLMIQSAANQPETGAQNIFIGQVRADHINETSVSAIEYTVNEEMAMDVLHDILEEAKSKYHTDKIIVLHRMGIVKVNEICLFVLTATGHREDAYDANRYIVERIKREVPIWGKEIFENTMHQWKTNRV